VPIIADDSEAMLFPGPFRRLLHSKRDSLDKMITPLRPECFLFIGLFLAWCSSTAPLVSNDAPENIFFAADPIDKRLPALEDAASWPLLLSRYSIVGFYGNYLHMLRDTQLTEMRLDRQRVAVTARINEWSTSHRAAVSFGQTSICAGAFLAGWCLRPSNCQG